jgi:hypothetical protein
MYSFRTAAAVAALCLGLAAPLSAQHAPRAPIQLAQADAATLKKRADLFLDEIRKGGSKVSHGAIEAGPGPEGLTVKDIVITSADNETVKIATLEVRSYDWANGKDGKFGDLSLLGIDMSLEEANKGGNGDLTPKDLGIERLKADLHVAYKADDAKKEIDISRLEFDMPELGSLKLALKVSGITAAELNALGADSAGGEKKDEKKEDGKEMAMLAKISLVGGAVSFQDKSLIGRLIKAQAAKKKVSEADARAEILKEMQGARAEAQDEFTKEAIDAAMKFLLNPGTLEVRMAPPAPFNLMGGFMMAMTAPGQLKQQLGITITVK